MDRTYRFRNGVIVFLIVLVAAIYAIRLFSIQLTKEDEASYSSSNTTTYTQYVSAARGEILDRHGNVLVSNRATYNVTLQSFVLFNSDDPNGYLLLLAQTCMKNGIEYEENLPLSDTTPYVYTTDELSSTDQYYFRRFLLNRGWDADMTAENLAKKLKDAYRISDEYTEEEARLIMGLRYELDLPNYAYADTYTLVADISADQLAILKELGIPGMDVVTTTVREVNTGFAAQILGHVGLMDSEEYENTYKDQGYSMNASVGKDGMEAAFEEYLHGTDGQKVVTVTSDGTVVDEYWEVEPKSGANVVTTIDIGMQEVAENSLAKYVQAMSEQGKAKNGNSTTALHGSDAKSGAVVAMNVNTGEILLSLVERRLDNVVYRLGFASTRREALQLVNHGHYTVNGKSVNIPSYLVEVGDVIAVSEKSSSNNRFKKMKEDDAFVAAPKWLDRDKNTLTGKVIALPARDDIDFEIAENLIVELYSK